MSRLDKYNVIWEEPGKDSCGSMPLGNGDIGVNVWMEEEGDLLFYIGKTDAWSENLRLLKLGRVRVHISPNPFVGGKPFKQELKLNDGMLEICAGDPLFIIRLWVDANNPAIHMEISAEIEFDTQVQLELWRENNRLIEGMEQHSSYTMSGSPEDLIEYTDTILEGQMDKIVWYHRNEHSIWPLTMKLQGLEGFMDKSSDPLLFGTFGGVVRGEGFTAINDRILKKVKPSTRSHIIITPFSMQAESVHDWLNEVGREVARIDAIDTKTARERHTQWWREFWDRSCIYISGSKEAEEITCGYILQRYINACGGRGAYPIKFNGSIFTMDTFEKMADTYYDADYRRWGGPYWFQNTRLIYWPMLGSGDFDLLMPFFKMYKDALPLAEYRTREYYGHEGAFFPETMCFWGSYTNACYGWDRQERHKSYIENPYVRYYWQGGLELAAMMVEYVAYTEDSEFVDEVLLPIARAVLDFYDKHYPRNEKGKLSFFPAASLETWHDVLNPLPEIAGIRYVIEGLLEIDNIHVPDETRRQWIRLLDSLPAEPRGTIGGREVIFPAQELIDNERRNVENPELYAVFPYKIYGVGKDDIELALATYETRAIKDNGGWHQDAIQAAYLGLTQDAKKLTIENFTKKNPECRFTAFWEAGNDWTPDQDHGGMASMALQAMLMQCQGHEIILFPAWPKDWDVEFKLHAPFNTIVEGSYRSGIMESLKVLPESRMKDLKIMK